MNDVSNIYQFRAAKRPNIKKPGVPGTRVSSGGTPPQNLPSVTILFKIIARMKFLVVPYLEEDQKGYPQKEYPWKGQISPILGHLYTVVSKGNFQKSPWSWIPLLWRPFWSFPNIARFCDTIGAISHIARYLLREFCTPPKLCDTLPWYLGLPRHICAIPHFATYRAIIVRYPIKTSPKEFCDTIATSIARYEKYRCWASKMKLLFSNYSGDYSYSFQGSSESISLTVTVPSFLAEWSYRK